MHQGIETDPAHSHDQSRPQPGMSSSPGRSSSVDDWEERTRQGVDRAQKTMTDAGNAVVEYIERNPVVAAGAALAIGAAVVMMVSARRSDSARLDRRALRAARDMERTFSREMRNLRRSDFADSLGRVGSSFGDAFSRLDLSPLADLGRSYLEAARAKIGR